MSRGRGQRAVTRQIDPGMYLVRSRQAKGEPAVGMVFVEGSGNVLIEHWVLSEQHASPDAERALVVEATDEPKAESLAGFFKTMRERSQSWEGTHYIKATCEYSDRIPDL